METEETEETDNMPLEGHLSTISYINDDLPRY